MKRVMPYKNSRRQWVKLWVNEWLQGTIRFELTAEQRSLWADLLAMAGASRLPGIIASGETNGIPSAYPPDYLSNLLRWKERPLQEALKLFEEQGRISMKKGVISIVNWTKYQSEYQRQAKYQEKYRKRLTSKLTPTLLVDEDVEGEGDKEGDITAVQPVKKKSLMEYQKRFLENLKELRVGGRSNQLAPAIANGCLSCGAETPHPDDPFCKPCFQKAKDYR